MGVGLRAILALASAVALALGGCGSEGDESDPPVTPSTELTTSGWVLAGWPTTEEFLPPEWSRSKMVADGTGQVWFLGPWQLIRLDPKSGQTTTWDASDDLQFASTRMTLASAARAGVWLMDGDRVRLFDGERFTVDLQVPAGIRNVEGGPQTEGWVTDVIQVGPQVWVSVLDAADIEFDSGCCDPHPGGGGRVARYSHGRWEAMSAPEDAVGGYLAVDRDGSVWASGLSSGRLNLGTARRWDGETWLLPGADAAPTEAGEVAADPTGGVWFASGADGLRHFDGSRWTAPVPNLYSLVNGFWTPGDRGLVVTSDGAAWVAFDHGLARVSADGATRIFGPAEGVEGLGGVAVGSDDSVVISNNHNPTVLRGEGDRFQPIWQGRPSTGWGSGQAVNAVSADEVWANSDDTWYRFRDGEWDELGPGGPYCLAVVATDGALWTASATGALARVTSEDGYRVVTQGPIDCAGWEEANLAGPAGSVWVIQDDDVVQYMRDGTRRSIGRPQSVDPPPRPDRTNPGDAERVCLHGVDPTGSVWVSELSDADDEECTAGTWHHWDGQRWTPADSPDPFTSAQDKVVAGDGIGWVLRAIDSGVQIARFAQGELVPVSTSPRLGSLTAVSGGRACAFEYGAQGDNIDMLAFMDPLAIVCFDASGEFARVDVAGRSHGGPFSVASDGSVWHLGPQVGRLPQSPPDG